MQVSLQKFQGQSEKLMLRTIVHFKFSYDPKKPPKKQLSSFTVKFPIFKGVLYSALASDVMPNT